MLNKCPICQGDLVKIDEKHLYCEKDDVTFSHDKGRFKVSSENPDGKESIQQLVLEVADQRLTLEKVIKKIFPDEKNMTEEERKEFWE